MYKYVYKLFSIPQKEDEKINLYKRNTTSARGMVPYGIVPIKK